MALCSGEYGLKGIRVTLGLATDLGQDPQRRAGGRQGWVPVPLLPSETFYAQADKSSELGRGGGCLEVCTLVLP